MPTASQKSAIKRYALVAAAILAAVLVYDRVHARWTGAAGKPGYQDACGAVSQPRRASRSGRHPLARVEEPRSTLVDAHAGSRATRTPSTRRSRARARPGCRSRRASTRARGGAVITRRFLDARRAEAESLHRERNRSGAPTALWGATRRPYPTGAWWTNLVVGGPNSRAAAF